MAVLKKELLFSNCSRKGKKMEARRRSGRAGRTCRNRVEADACTRAVTAAVVGGRRGRRWHGASSTQFGRSTQMRVAADEGEKYSVDKLNRVLNSRVGSDSSTSFDNGSMTSSTSSSNDEISSLKAAANAAVTKKTQAARLLSNGRDAEAAAVDATVAVMERGQTKLGELLSSSTASGSNAPKRMSADFLNRAYERCGVITEEYAKTFYLGTQLMTEEKRKAIWAIYGK